MLVDELEQGDVAILDAALSAERLDQQADSGPIAHSASKTDLGQPRIGAARGALSAVLLGVALWAAILAPIIRH